MSVSCSLRTSCGGAGCISSMNPPAVSFPRERDRPGSWGSCFQMVHAYTQGQCIWAMQGCMWWVLSTALSLPLRRPLFLPAACVSVGDGFSSALPRLALSCLFQDCVPPYIGGDGPVCLQWLAGLRVQTSALWSPCRAILKSSTRQESPAGSPGTAAETSLWFILSHCPVLPPSGSCSWGLSHGTYISESVSLGTQPETGGYCNFTPFWTCRKCALLKLQNSPGSQSWRGTERELHCSGLQVHCIPLLSSDSVLPSTGRCSAFICPGLRCQCPSGRGGGQALTWCWSR